MALLYFESWCKYDRYKLKQHKEKGLYLCSAGDKRQEYNPFERRTEILFALFNLGMLAKQGKDIVEKALDFTSRFGFLGFGQAVIELEYEDCSIKFHHGNPFGVDVMHYTDFADLIFPFEKKSHRIIKGNESKATILFAINYEENNRIPCAIFHPEYCEQSAWTMHYAAYLYQTLLKFYDGNAFVHRLWNVKTYIREDGKQKWQFDSLKSAVDIMFLELLQSEAPIIKLCKRCRKPYVSQSKKSQYCSASCRNVYHVKRSRQKKRSCT